MIDPNQPGITIPEDPNQPFYACDFNAPDYQGMYRCIVKDDFTPGDIPCNIDNNRIAMVDPATMDQQTQQNFLTKFIN